MSVDNGRTRNNAFNGQIKTRLDTCSVNGLTTIGKNQGRHNNTTATTIITRINIYYMRIYLLRTNDFETDIKSCQTHSCSYYDVHNKLKKSEFTPSK